ncbi:MAG: hypothetical protein H3C43_01830 [Leptonema sp. (in: Bacteria)]|nr:hypothetical protein [Leptonema sp. (in: bacteria)]
MDYHYKSPDEIRAQYGKSSNNFKNPIFNRAFFFILADISIILIAGAVLYFSGYSDLLKSGEGAISVTYSRIDTEHIQLHFSTRKKDVTLIDSHTILSKDQEQSTAILNEIRYEVEQSDQILILKDAPTFDQFEIKPKQPQNLILKIPEIAQTTEPLKLELRFNTRKIKPELKIED